MNFFLKDKGLQHVKNKMNDQNVFLVKDKRAKVYVSLDFSIKIQP